jgi:hypothetical protein
MFVMNAAMGRTRAVDPDSLNPDTDPDSIRIQGFDDQKLKETMQLKTSVYLF